MLDKIRYWGGGFMRSRMRRQAAELLTATQDARQTQHDVLRRLIALNGDSTFGRDHDFAGIRTVADFRSRLPIAQYDYFEPYIEQLKQGNPSALLGPQNKLLMFTLTSGTTSGAKYIPITSQFMSDYRRGWRIWGVSAYDSHPSLYLLRIVQLASDYDQFRTDGGTPCGNISGLVTAMQNPMVRSMYAVPQAAMKIDQSEAKYYTVLRTSLVDARVGMVTTANPSTFIHLARLADAEKESLIRDIAEGTRSKKFAVSADIRQKLRRQLRPNPRRARELEAIVNRTGHLYPKEFWPDLGLMAVWTGGSAGTYLSSLPQYYGNNVPVRDHGLSASEGRMTIPLETGTSSGVLDVNSHFFEFVPEEEMGKDKPIVLEAHELEAGRNYFILLTTASGLYRYDIHDVVHCTGFTGTTPQLEFLNKGAHISSITGEKISESQVVTAVRECTERNRLDLGHFTVAPAWGEPPRYQFLVERGGLPSANAGTQLVEETDFRLRALNPEYADKRKTGRLGPMALELLPEGTWDRFCRKRQSRLGGSVEQYKHPCLVPHLEFYADFMGEFVDGRRNGAEGIARPYSLSANRVEAR